MQLVEINWAKDRPKYIDQMALLEYCFGSDAFSPDQLDHALSLSSYIFAVVDDGMILCYTATDQSDDSAPGQYIWQLVTDPDHRGKGLASQVLYALIDKGLDLHLHVRTDNTVAQGLYLDTGFKIHGTVQDYYHDGTSALHLTRNTL